MDDKEPGIYPVEKDLCSYNEEPELEKEKGCIEKKGGSFTQTLLQDLKSKRQFKASKFQRSFCKTRDRASVQFETSAAGIESMHVYQTQQPNQLEDQDKPAWGAGPGKRMLQYTPPER